jgi:superfamily II DNA or RNA helicase
MLKLRDYQMDVIKRTHKSLSDGNKRIIICLPTGSGKTACFAWLANQTQLKNKKVWFVVHRKELLDQTIKTFEKFNIPTTNISIGMVHSFANHSEKYSVPDLIIYDECHHCSASTWGKIINSHPDSFTIGLTATPCRLDSKPLGDIYTDLIIGKTTNELIQDGFLSEFKYFAPSVSDLSGLKKRGKDYDAEQAGELLSTRAVFGDVLRHWHELADGLQTICYCSSVKHSIATAEAFQSDGINAVHFDGNTPKAERTEIIEKFRNGEIKMLCNVDLIGEGFDCPDCWCCVLLRPTTSLGLFIQQSGRALRPQPNKTAIIIDHVNNYSRHGLPNDDRQWSLNAEIKTTTMNQDGTLKVRQCLKCYATFQTAPVCPYCGAIYESTREEIKQIESVHLKEIKQRKQDRIETARIITQERVGGGRIEDCKSLFECQQFCKANNKSSKFAWVYWNKLRRVHN